jgi:S1-C subfamily serine protease
MNRIFKPALVIMAVLLVSSLSLRAAPAATSAVERDIALIAKKSFPAVVQVEARNHTRRIATGVVVDADGYVLTTALMSPRDEKITITTSDGKTVEAEFLGFDTETRLALLKAKDKGLPALPLGKPGDLAAGSWVCVIGISPERTPAVTQGIVSSVAEDRLRLNIWVTPGSSGGPVIDEKGQMVGILRGVYIEERPVVFQFRDKEQAGSGFVMGGAEAPASGMAVAVPIDVVRNIAAQIKDKGKVERGWLGVAVGMNEDGRVEIGEIDPDSPAELAKLREGDIILKLDGVDIANREMLGVEVRKRKPGQDVVVKVERDGKPMDVRVKLGEYAEDQAKREMETLFPGIFPPLAPKPQPSAKAPQWDKSAPQPEARKAVPGKPSQPSSRPGFPSLEMRKFIGVWCNELNPELAAYFGVKEGTGLIIARLTEKGPAEQAGIKVGDVIVRVDGKRVETQNDLIDLIQAKKKGDKIRIEVLRDKKAMTIDVAVEEEELDAGFFGSGGVRSLLESWQGYTDAFRDELKKWQGEYVPELRANMKTLNEEFAKRSRESAKQIKRLFRTPLKKV